eukprot:8666249-Alexandrium_andersonii.AAC.1
MDSTGSSGSGCWTWATGATGGMPAPPPQPPSAAAWTTHDAGLHLSTRHPVERNSVGLPNESQLKEMPVLDGYSKAFPVPRERKF